MLEKLTRFLQKIVESKPMSNTRKSVYRVSNVCVVSSQPFISSPAPIEMTYLTLPQFPHLRRPGISYFRTAPRRRKTDSIQSLTLPACLIREKSPAPFDIRAGNLLQ